VNGALVHSKKTKNQGFLGQILSQNIIIKNLHLHTNIGTNTN
jgi:hypothetical protein